MINAQSELSFYTETQRFVDGFRHGARFILDTFIEPK